MKRKLAFGVYALTLLVVQVQAQDKEMAKPMMEIKAAKSKMMEPYLLMAASR